MPLTMQPKLAAKFNLHHIVAPIDELKDYHSLVLSCEAQYGGVSVITLTAMGNVKCMPVIVNGLLHVWPLMVNPQNPDERTSQTWPSKPKDPEVRPPPDLPAR